MKTKLLFISFVLLTISLWSQDKSVTFSGGWVWANIEDADTDASGWRINAAFELSPIGSNFTHGIALGYISTSGSDKSGEEKVTFDLTSVPIYYAPKYSFGSDKFEGFLKGMAGMHFSSYDRSGLIDLSTSDVGFYGGLGLGAQINVNEKIFVNAEYEWAYLSNSYYRDGFVNTIMIGIGFNL